MRLWRILKVQNLEISKVQSFMSAPTIETKELNNLFFELTDKIYNLKYGQSNLQKGSLKKDKNFLSIDKIKQTLLLVRNQNIKSLYLTGTEPMLHPEFNSILRMCLKISNTTIITSGTFINDKKARFLRKIDDESDFETIYRINFYHFDEQKNDMQKGRGSFRKALFAVQNLYKYDFNPIISITNYYNEKREILFENFSQISEKFGFELGQINLKITPYFDPNPINHKQIESEDINPDKLDCINSRILSSKGIFTCPLLCNDFRARSGYSIENFAKRVCLDTEKCYTCVKHDTKAFVNDWM